jgi:hypothetical protein
MLQNSTITISVRSIHVAIVYEVTNCVKNIHCSLMPPLSCILNEGFVFYYDSV